MGRPNQIGLLALLVLVACSSPLAKPSPPEKQAPPAAKPGCSCPTGDGILTFPPELPALPTLVEADTCQATLARGGVAVHASSAKDCQVRVTLANGAVLTSTASFKPLPEDCCSNVFLFAAASPFQVSNPGKPDASPLDASANARFPEWWYPECGTPANACPETCGPVKVIAAPAACGPYEELMVGCVPRDQVVAGWFCVMRSSDGEIIFTEEGPSNPAGFEMCPPPIKGNLPQVPSSCPDAAAP